jgi:hypothetical protein
MTSAATTAPAFGRDVLGIELAGSADIRVVR